MIQLSIPQVGEESRNIKDLVFTLLSQEQPLSLIELTNKIKRQYAIGVTYQAVRKAVDTLRRSQVLAKTDKKYAINKAWVLEMKSFFDHFLTTYESKTSIKRFSIELAKEEYAVYTFTNLLDLDNFWGDIMLYWAHHEKQDKSYLSIVHYNWWLTINLGKETKIFDDFKKLGIKSHFVISHDVPLNRWAATIYHELNVKTILKSLKLNDPLVDINIMGNTVIQVKYPSKIMHQIKQLFEKYKTIQEMSSKEVTALAHEQCEIKFIMFKNPTIAKNLRETYISYFRQ